MAGMGQWRLFVAERFPPATYLLTVAVFVVAHAKGADATNTPQLLALGLGTLCFFFKLRLCDELKDHQSDCLLNPTRPLVRGLLSHRDLHLAIRLCIALELVSFSIWGPQALAGIALPVAYSLLMYREFFVSTWLRPRLAFYAVVHTAVSVPLSIALLAAITHRYPWDLEGGHYCFATASWCLFNIFEFGRKSFSSSEEQPGADSYSGLYGRGGALALVLIMSGSANLLFSTAGLAAALPLRGCLLAAFLALAVAGITYVIADRPFLGRLYRATTAAYIITAYAALAFIDG